MRVTISRGFVQPLLTWETLERQLLAHPQLSAEFVASLRRQIPAVSMLSADRLKGIGAKGEQWRSTLVVVRQARSELQASRRSSLVTLMGRSRGWAHGTRAKTYLTLLWQHQRGRISIDDLFDHVGVDRRSANQALRDLADLGFIELLDFSDRAARHDVPSGQPVQVRGQQLELLSDLGTGDVYQRPEPGTFFQVGDELWTDGWMARMPGQGLAVLLVLLSRVDSRDPTGPIWVAASQVRNWYGFSDRVWSTGVRYLRSAKLVTMHQPGAPDSSTDHPDRRKFYSPAGLTHPWLVPAKLDTEHAAAAEPSDASSRVPIPDGAHVLYLKQDRRLYTPFLKAITELRVAYGTADGPVEKYKCAREIVRFAAEQLETIPDESETALRTWARVQIDDAPAYSSATPHRPLPAHEGYRHLVSLLEHDGEHAAALELAKEAKEQRWGRTRPGPESWDATIVRLGREVRRRSVEERVATYTEEELLSAHEISSQPPDGNQDPTRESSLPFREAVKRLRVEYEIADNVVEKFERARAMVLFAAKQRTEQREDADTLLRAWSRIQIDHAEGYFKTKKGQRRRVHEGYRYLADLLETDGEVDEALRLAQEAKREGWGRTQRDVRSWDKTIERLNREVRRRSENKRLGGLPDGELYAPTKHSSTG